ncbi:transcription factor adf-1 [Plakobranchus ocellatus]|uniref:Transcription factor adf-1 n=1 Tax=Plakobranchus ocellatus TaxID=259542 RepID=A0AAV3YB15_9GAST|nr:transcription factor adf-1 [Plakobranchus ocellatus]
MRSRLAGESHFHHTAGSLALLDLRVSICTFGGGGGRGSFPQPVHEGFAVKRVETTTRVGFEGEHRMNRADREFAEKLVIAVEKRPVLYQTSHPDHKDRSKIELLWAEIAAELNSTVENVRRRWQNLRGSFSKSLAAMKLPSGSAA